MHVFALSCCCYCCSRCVCGGWFNLSHILGMFTLALLFFLRIKLNLPLYGHTRGTQLSRDTWQWIAKSQLESPKPATTKLLTCLAFIQCRVSVSMIKHYYQSPYIHCLSALFWSPPTPDTKALCPYSPLLTGNVQNRMNNKVEFDFDHQWESTAGILLTICSHHKTLHQKPQTIPLRAVLLSEKWHRW